MDVHRAARIAAAGHGGQVLLSQTTRDLVTAEDVRDLGEHRLKDLSAPERMFQLGDERFPPLKSLRQTNLPVPATPFLGRARELEQVVGLLRDTSVRLLTLTGPGGAGKTRLALQAAAEVAEDLPDGVWWVSLAPLRDPALALDAVAKALDVRERPGVALEETLADSLASKRALLLIDNAEHLLPQVARDIARLRQAGGAKLFVTSRERLQLQGEHAWTVPSLDEHDGPALFAARARALRPEFSETAATAELCNRLDNLPLALELAAARIPLFSPEQLLERLGQGLDLKGGRDADSRQQTLDATIRWSYDLLLPEEQRLFGRLAVFAGGCTYEAAEAVCGAEIDTLQSLIDKSLLRSRDVAGRTRFWMLETIREFAVRQLEVSDEVDALRLRHAEFFADQVLPRLNALPGVKSAGMTSVIPFGDGWSTASFNIEGLVVPPGQNGPWGDYRVSSPRFFEALRIPLEKGRLFPGLAQALRLISRDETRHIRFGVYMLQLLIQEHPGMWDVVQGRMNELLPYVLGMLGSEENPPPEDGSPVEYIVPPDELTAFAMTQFQRRMRVLERARTQSRVEVEEETSDELTEEFFAG